LKPRPDGDARTKRQVLPFRQRVAIGFGAAALLIVATGAVSYYALHEMVASYRAFSNQAREVIEFGRLRAAIEKTVAAARGFLITGDEKFLSEIARWRGDLHAQIESLRVAGLDSREKELLAEIERAEEAHQRATERAIAMKLGGQSAGYVAQTVEPARESLERGVSAYLYHEKQLLEQTDSLFSQKTAVASLLIVICGVLALGLTLILGLTLTRRLSQLYETERHERKLSETARLRYRDLVEGIPGGLVWEADALTLRMNFVSRRAKEMLGYAPEESASDPSFWTRLIPVEDRERVLALAARALQDRTEQQFEHRFLASDGRTVWFQTRVRVREEEGRPAVLRGLSVDVTRLKEAEARAAFLAEASAALASSLDYRTTLASVAQLLVPRIADGSAVDMLDANGQLSRVTTSHSDPSRALAAQEVANRYPPELGAPHGAGRVVATGEAQVLSDVTEEVLRAMARDEEHLRLLRSLRLVSLMCVPLSTRGKTLGAITLASSESGRRFGPEDLAFAQDLAGRASVAIENSRLYREAREAVRARDEFLSIASHELKTPLTTLQLQVQGLARKLKSSVEKPALQGLAARVATSERQVERLTALINNLLDISRITAGRLDLDLEPVDLAAVAKEAAARFGEDLARAGCVLELRAEGECVGQWDRLRLEQVVTNLLSNAAKYGAGRPIEIEVDGGEATARFSIRDHGIGIPAEHQARIFERFERAVSDRHYGGLGLGLWIVRQIVDAFGGTIRVESRAGAGSTFTVLLPRAAQKPRMTGT
jgi:PAS domain S-box-containing protein